MPRILYFNFDNPRPSGGLRTIYTHVAHLVRSGLSAYVVHQNAGFRPGWFQEDVPKIYAQQGLSIRPDDLLIIPEDHRVVLDGLKSVAVRKVIFCQNHFNIYIGLGQHRFWQDLGISKVFASSEIIAGFLQSKLGWPEVPVVHYALDRDLFKPWPKKLQVAYVPQKRPLEAEFICRLAAQDLGFPSDVTWAPIDRVNEAETARIMGESAIFLSMNYLEGFGLPPVEAMAAGCVVVGNHGYGGMEYATPDNGFWCEEGNPLACADALRQVVDLVRQGSPEVQRRIDAAIVTAARYTLQRQRSELLAFIEGVLKGG
ncbi:MAG TPA: glycosyltransferase family 4 protein [Gemmataceae bacterium]|nr:glycosyltransferase family 4 protein [Gemmataceae bacterium]